MNSLLKGLMRLFILSICCTLSFIACSAQAEKTPDTILNYWFGDQNEEYPYEKSKIWFGGGSDVDREIRDRFEYLLFKAKNNELEHWKKTPRGRLALIILVDQFTRNIYRGTAEAFAFDFIAQELTLEGLAKGEDLKLSPIERAFFYLPLEHSEEIALQKLSIAKFNTLEDDSPQSLKTIFESYADYALKHYEIIDKFGRFPHRNAILGRESTIDELEFLLGPNSSF